MKAHEELRKLYDIEQCPECHSATGDDTEYKDFSNRNVIICSQCGYEWYTNLMPELRRQLPECSPRKGPVTEQVIFVTEDKWQRVEGGVLDPTDEAIRQEASQNGKIEVVVMNVEQSFRAMQAAEPEKWDQFHKGQEAKVGKPLTVEEIVELGRQGNEKMRVYAAWCRVWMTEAQAREVRVWRVYRHYTWRAVARAAFKRRGKWPDWHPWQPESNQIMGMALCERAASMLGENYRQEPWN